MIVGFVMGTATLLFSYPYSLEYHTLEHHSGTVSKVERRIVTDGSESANITREVAFWFEGEELAYGTTDIRLNGVKPGDVVELRRQLNWNYGGVDHWDVKFLDLTPAAN